MSAPPLVPLQVLADAQPSPDGVSPWVCCPQRGDHIYPTCPAARRSEGGYAIVNDPRNRLDPDGGWVCGWCRRLWHLRGKPSRPFGATA